MDLYAIDLREYVTEAMHIEPVLVSTQLSRSFCPLHIEHLNDDLKVVSFVYTLHHVIIIMWLIWRH